MYVWFHIWFMPYLRCMCVCVWMNMYLYLLLIWSIDEKSLLSDEDLGALESLQSGFQKCVVSFYLYI